MNQHHSPKITRNSVLINTKSEKIIPSLEVKDAQTKTMTEENLSYTAEQVATSSGRKQKPTRSNLHILPPMQQWMEEVERKLQKKVQEEIQTAIKTEIENHRLRLMVAKKNKTPPQPAVLHSQNTAEREDEGNSNQPEEDMGNTTPPDRGRRTWNGSERPMERSCKEKKTQNNRNKP